MDITNTFVLAAAPVPQIATWVADPGDKPAVTVPVAAPGPSTSSPVSARPLHHLGEVRRREHITRRAAAQRLGVSIREVEEQENPSSDLRLSDLYRWEKALRVPMTELLNEPDGVLSPPVELRARLLRAMKTVRLIQERARQVSTRRLVEMLVDQLVEVMPELKDTTAWPATGPRRSRNDLGQAYFRRPSLHALNELDRLEEE
jgi:transcriptional regulator with XRE-family HTH domain